MGERHLEVALPAGADPRRHARALARVHEASLAGERPAVAPRPVISASWRRMRRLRVDPDRGAAIRLLDIADVERRRRASRMAALVPLLRSELVGAAEHDGQLIVVVDGDGYVLWRDGPAAVRRRADGLGFFEGASWCEDSVGTNAIGTALVARRPVQVYAAEHYVRSHHVWTCSAAPLRDPRDGSLLGVVDLSGPSATVHASTLALVDAVTRLAQVRLRDAHLAELNRLRAVVVPAVTLGAERVLVTDPHGWVAAASGMPPPEKVSLPVDCMPGPAWLPALGDCVLDPVPGGWLIRVTAGERPVPTVVTLDLTDPRSASLTVGGTGGDWTCALSPRHAEMLYLLAAHPAGRSAANLAADLFDDPQRTVTVRAEMSRIRRQVGGVLARRPYRFADGIDVRVRLPADPEDLLRHSTASAVRGPAALGMRSECELIVSPCPTAGGADLRPLLGR